MAGVVIHHRYARPFFFPALLPPPLLCSISIMLLGVKKQASAEVTGNAASTPPAICWYGNRSPPATAFDRSFPAGASVSAHRGSLAPWAISNGLRMFAALNSGERSRACASPAAVSIFPMALYKSARIASQ